MHDQYKSYGHVKLGVTNGWRCLLVKLPRRESVTNGDNPSSSHVVQFSKLLVLMSSSSHGFQSSGRLVLMASLYGEWKRLKCSQASVRWSSGDLVQSLQPMANSRACQTTHSSRGHWTCKILKWERKKTRAGREREFLDVSTTLQYAFLGCWILIN